MQRVSDWCVLSLSSYAILNQTHRVTIVYYMAKPNVDIHSLWFSSVEVLVGVAYPERTVCGNCPSIAWKECELYFTNVLLGCRLSYVKFQSIKFHINLSSLKIFFSLSVVFIVIPCSHRQDTGVLAVKINTISNMYKTYV